MYTQQAEVSGKSLNSTRLRATTGCVAILGAFALGDRANGGVPNPVVTGPIPALATPGDPSHNYPFFSTSVDLASYGYVEEEFFFEGTANRYNTPPLGTGTIIDSGHAYRTRMVVRRPVSPTKFNGTVLVEWQNVTVGFDADLAWEAFSDYIIRKGYAWVGVSAQRVGVDQPTTGLRNWSPNRYGTLDVTEGGTITPVDALSYDIFSQAIQAVRSPVGIYPLNTLHAERVIAMGVSQSAYRLAVYHNSIHPLAGVVDGFLLVGGTMASFAEPSLRTDLNVKVFKLLSETDIALLTEVALRQPDSDHFRRWEVAGAAHIDFQALETLRPLVIREGFAFPFPVCTLPPLSRIPYRFTGYAAIDHLVRWITDNTQPPSAPEITVVSAGPPVVVARDSFGNALGGIRLPQFDVPTATNTGVNSGAGLCRLFGSYQPFDDATLNSLYSNHGVYVNQVTQSARKNVWNGFLLQGEAAVTIEEAAHSGFGKK